MEKSPYVGYLLQLKETWFSFLAYQSFPCIPSALYIYLKSTSARFWKYQTESV